MLPSPIKLRPHVPETMRWPYQQLYRSRNCKSIEINDDEIPWWSMMNCVLFQIARKVGRRAKLTFVPILRKIYFNYYDRSCHCSHWISLLSFVGEAKDFLDMVDAQRTAFPVAPLHLHRSNYIAYHLSTPLLQHLLSLNWKNNVKKQEKTKWFRWRFGNGSVDHEGCFFGWSSAQGYCSCRIITIRRFRDHIGMLNVLLLLCGYGVDKQIVGEWVSATYALFIRAFAFFQPDLRHTNPYHATTKSQLQPRDRWWRECSTGCMASNCGSDLRRTLQTLEMGGISKFQHAHRSSMGPRQHIVLSHALY